MIRRILYPTDFSPASRPALKKAIELAKANHGRIIVTHVLAPVLPMADGYLSPQAYEQMETAGRRFATRQLKAVIAKVKKAGVQARGLLLEGTPAERIVRAARAQRADVVVMGTHGRTGFARFVLGSVAGRVVGHASCPVLTVRGA